MSFFAIWLHNDTTTTTTTKTTTTTRTTRTDDRITKHFLSVRFAITARSVAVLVQVVAVVIIREYEMMAITVMAVVVTGNTT